MSLFFFSNHGPFAGASCTGRPWKRVVGSLIAMGQEGTASRPAAGEASRPWGARTPPRRQDGGMRLRVSHGIGLAIVKKIAETRNGRAWVESTPGTGASFHVTLPIR